MDRVRNYLLYLIFPLAGILLALTLPPDKVPLRILVAVVISAIGIIAADSDFRPSSLSLRNIPRLVGVRTEERAVDRTKTAARLMSISIIFMILSALTFSPLNNTDHRFTVPIFWMLCGLAAAWLSFRFAEPPVQVVTPARRPLQPLRGNLSLALLGVLLLFAAAEAGGKSLGIDLLLQVPMGVQALLFYGGIVLLVMGLGAVRWNRPFRLPATDVTSFSVGGFIRRHQEAVVVILIFVGAFLIRVWNLETGLRMSADEAISIDGVGHYYGSTVGLVARPSGYITSLLFPQWQGVVISLLGRTVTTLRLTSVIVGALTVVMTYFLTRDLFKDRRAGAIAALFLMTFPPHVHFSRISLLHIADPLVGTLALWFVIRGIRWNRRLDWALAGAALGLTQYFFEAGRLFYFPLEMVWLALAAALVLLLSFLKAIGRRLPGKLARGGAIQIPHIPMAGVLIAVMAFIMVAMPSYYALFSRGGDVNPRLTESGGFNFITDPMQDGLTGSEAVELARRLLFPLTIFVHQPEIAVFYGGDQPLMLVYVVPFFLLGLAYLLWRWRSTAVVILLWVAATAGTNALLRDSAVFARWHVVFPAIAIVVAVALRYLLPVIWSRAANPEEHKPVLVFRPLAGGLVAVVLAFMMIGQITYYYGWHTPLLEKQSRLSKPYPDGFDMALRARNFPSSTDIYQIGDPIPDIHVPQAWISFLTSANRETLRYFPMASQDITTEFVAQLPRDRNLAFFVDPHSVDTVALLEGLGCTMQSSPYPMDPPDKAYLLCFIPQSENSGTEGQNNKPDASKHAAE